MGKGRAQTRRLLRRLLLLWLLANLVSGCAIYLTFPGSHTWFVYPPDSVVVPPAFEVVVGSVRSSAGFGYQAFGGDTDVNALLYGIQPHDFSLWVDGKKVRTVRARSVTPVQLKLPEGIHTLELRDPNSGNQIHDQLQVQVDPHFPFKLLPLPDTLFNEQWITLNGKQGQWVEGNGLGAFITSAGDSLEIEYYQHEQKLWHHSVYGYVKAAWPIQTGIYFLINTYEGKLQLFWADSAPLTLKAEMEALALPIEPCYCDKGLAIPIATAYQKGVYTAGENGRVEFHDTPLSESAQQNILPDGWCDNGKPQPSWIVLTYENDRFQRGWIHTLNQRYPLPVEWTKETYYVHLLRVKNYLLSDGGMALRWFHEGKWVPLYAKVPSLPGLTRKDCMPPAAGVVLLVIPIPFWKTDLTCSTSLPFSIDGEWIQGPAGKYYALQVP